MTPRTTWFAIPPYLLSACDDVCRDLNCPDAAARRLATGRWFITMGHAGFNAPTNNRTGYASRASAMAAHRRYDGGAR